MLGVSWSGVSNILSTMVINWARYYFVDILVYCSSCTLLNDLKSLRTQVATSIPSSDKDFNNT